MDLPIKIVDRHFVCSLYAKLMALYLYLLPPSSSHPTPVMPPVYSQALWWRGVIVREEGPAAAVELRGETLIYGQVLRIYQLCSQSNDIDKELTAFYHRLLARGYHPHQILPLLKKAINNACTYLTCTDDKQCFITQAKETASKQRVFFHLPFHPQLRPLLRSNASGASMSPNHQENHRFHIPVRQLIVAYRQYLNLHNDNVLSYRKLRQCKGPKVSSYLSNSRGK